LSGRLQVLTGVGSAPAGSPFSQTLRVEILMRQSNIATCRDSLRDRGFARFDLSEFVWSRNLDRTFKELLLACERLPPDDDHPNGRRRRYGQAIYLARPRFLYPYPPQWDDEKGCFVTSFYQPANFNPMDGDKVRTFGPLTEALLANAFLHEVVVYLFEHTPLAEYPGPQIWLVGLHIIALTATTDIASFSTPDCLHRDGEPVTAAILLRRDAGVVGGANWISTPSCAGRRPNDVSPEDILGRFILEHPLEGYIVIDKHVAHYIEPISVSQGYERACRVVLLVDFTPLKPDLDPA
jgi:hypothetical protein